MFSDFSENRAVFEIMSKNMVGPQRKQKIWRQRVAYWISEPTCVQVHTGARTPTRTHACPHPRTRAHIHTEICYTYYFPLQQWFRKRASILSYTYAVCFVLSLIYPFGVLFGFVLHNSLPFMAIISDLENVYK